MLTAGPPEPQLRDVICLQACTIFFFVRTFFYMNIQAEISQNFKNTLRLRVNFYFALSFG